MAPEGSQPSGSLSASVGLGWAGGGAWVPALVPACPEDGRQWGSQRGPGCSCFRAMEKRVFSSFLSQDACLQSGTCSQTQERLTWGCDRTEDTMKPLRSAEPGLRRARAQSPPDTCGKEAVRTRVTSILDYPARVGPFGATCSAAASWDSGLGRQLGSGAQGCPVGPLGLTATLASSWQAPVWTLLGLGGVVGCRWPACAPRKARGPRPGPPRRAASRGVFPVSWGMHVSAAHSLLSSGQEAGLWARSGDTCGPCPCCRASPTPHTLGPQAWVTFQGRGPGPSISARRTPGPPHPLHLAAVGAAG